MSALAIRAVGADAFRTAIDWAAAEGWNPGRDDLAAFHATDTDGFLMGYRDGLPISSISVVRYGSDFGFLGFYIVHPDHRGAGAGMATWEAGMAHLAGRTIGLDGVVAQQGNYRKSGFVLAGRNIRHSGVPKFASDCASPGIRTAREADRSALLAYDRAFFAAPRDDFTALWALPRTGVERVAKVAVSDGQVTGYGVIRRCLSGYKVCPLFADDEGTALALFGALCRSAGPGDEVTLDTPEGNPAALRLAERHGLRPVFETARMYRGRAPDLPTGRIFGITTFELG